MSDMPKKRWGDRKDARWIRDMDSLHVILPHLMNHLSGAVRLINAQSREKHGDTAVFFSALTCFR